MNEKNPAANSLPAPSNARLKPIKLIQRGTTLNLPEDKAGDAAILIIILIENVKNAWVSLKLYQDHNNKMLSALNSRPSYEWRKAAPGFGFQKAAASISAHSFLYAFNNFLSVARQLQVYVPGIEPTVTRLSDAFPQVQAIRNSANHLEDRARLKGPSSKAPLIRPHPILKDGLMLSNAVVLGSLGNDNLGYMTADGSHHSLAITENSYLSLQNAAQEILDLLPLLPGDPGFEMKHSL